MWLAVRPHFLNRFIALDLAFVASLIFVWFFPQFANSILDPIERLGASLARKKTAAICGLALAIVLVRISLLPVSPVPIPHFHDEFSYLLAGDTFAHGRLTNPPHPMWIYFETFHVNQHPTYMSKYPPAQGAVLALGQLLGNPWFGVLLSMCAMCAAVLWMLQGWLPPSWALLGALFVALRLGISSYWMNSYWGGAVAAIGGALVVGALPRILRAWRLRDSLILGLGVAVLVNSRPFEGFFLCLPVAIVLVARLCSNRGPSRSARLRRFVLPFSLVALLTVAFAAYYNWRGTGSALLPPYSLNERTYARMPTFIWQKPRPPLHFNNPQFDAYYNFEMYKVRPETLRQFWKHVSTAAGLYVKFFLWPELLLPTLALPWMLRHRRMCFLFALVAIGFAAPFLTPWFPPLHYFAPSTACLFALVIQGVRYVRLFSYHGRPIGVGLVRLMVALAIIQVVFHAQPIVLPGLPATEYRMRFESQLNTLPGKHLVIVRYAPDHNVHVEWVYNHADIDGAKTVWAREIPGTPSKPLLDYFQGRRVWLAEPDLTPPRLTPYPDAHSNP